MSSNSDVIQKELVTICSRFYESVATLNELGKTDWAKSAELLYKDLLPIIFGQEFDMPIKVNNDTFDLSGKAEGQVRVLVQVTSRTDAAKIRETLKKYVKEGYAAQYGKLYFVLIARRPQFKLKTFVAYEAVFDYKEQVIGISELIARITANGVDALVKAHSVATKHLSQPEARVKAENERLLKTILDLKTKLIASQANVHTLVEPKVAISGHDDVSFTQALTRLQSLLQTMRDQLDRFYETVNTDIVHSQEPIRQGLANLTIKQITLMGDLAQISGSQLRTRELALLIQKMELEQATIDQAQAKLEELAQEEQEIKVEIESALFEMKLLSP